MINWNNLDSLDSFKKLQALKGAVSIKKELNNNGADRVFKYNIKMGGNLSYNFAAKQARLWSFLISTA